MTRQTITQQQFTEISAAIDACAADLPEGRARTFRFTLKEALLAELRVPKAERHLGRLKLPDLAAIRATDFARALEILQRLAALPAAA